MGCQQRVWRCSAKPPLSAAQARHARVPNAANWTGIQNVDLVVRPRFTFSTLPEISPATMRAYFYFFVVPGLPLGAEPSSLTTTTLRMQIVRLVCRKHSGSLGSD
jgi:hypothetical protein